MDIIEFSDKLQKLYDEMSETFSSYQNSTGLTCLPGCGKCCENPEIEVSPLEMIPLALKLIKEERVDEYLDDNPGICHAYRNGRCSEYLQRPSVCRMFGAAGYFDKHRQVLISTCQEIKKAHPENFAAAHNDLNAPMFTHWSAKLSNIDPQILQERFPIRKAARIAIEKVSLYAQYNHV